MSKITKDRSIPRVRNRPMDKQDRILLERLQINSRESLTSLSKAVSLSIDATHKRIKRLQSQGIISRFSVFLDPKALGFELVANIQIKLNNISEDELSKLISFLKAHPQVIEVISTMGEYDITTVIISKNTDDLESLSRHIRQKFRSLIADWKSVINLKVHKFEEYQL